MSNNFTERYTADGVSKIFSFNFPVPDESWVDVDWMQPAATSFTDATGFSVELASKGGNVIFNIAPPTNTVILISPKQPQAAPSPVCVAAKESEDSPASLSALLFDEFKDSYKAFQKECSTYLEKMDERQQDFNTNASQLLQEAQGALIKSVKDIKAHVEAAKTQTNKQVEIVTGELNKIISDARTTLASEAVESKGDISDLRKVSAQEMADTINLAISKIDNLGKEKIRAITDIATDFNAKLASIYDAKAKQIKDFNLQVDGLVVNAEQSAKESFQEVYDQFILQVSKIKDELFAVVKSTQEALVKENEKTLQGIKDTGEQACAELRKVQGEFADKIKSYADQMEKCVQLACEYKEMAYSAAGNKGWIVYRKIMPSTDAEIKELHTIINDGGLVIAATEFPEDGGGNPTGGTNTQDFWCMVKQVAAYQEVVEKLLGNISPEDLENLHSYFEYLSNVLAELEKQEQLIKGLNITTASLDERIKRNIAEIETIKQDLLTQQAAIIDLQNKLVDLAILVDKNMEENKIDLDTQIKALKEEHERLGFLYASMDKRVTALEGK